MRKRISIVVAAIAAAAIAPSAAGAHAAVTSRTPAPGASLHNVRSVTVGFGESIVTGKLTISRSGRTVGRGMLVDRNRRITAHFGRSLAKGSYTVSWRALSDDGHRESGTWRFTIS